MHTPLQARHVVTKTTEQIAGVQSNLDNSLQTLAAEHGPGSAREYSSDVFTRRQGELRAEAIEALPSDIEGVFRGAKATLEHSDDFGRAGVLRKAQIVPESKPGDDPMLAEIKRLNENFALDRTGRAIAAATDEELAGRYAEQAIRDNDLPLASMLLDEGARRGDLVGMQVRRTIDTLPLPQVDKDTEHLEHLAGEIKDLEADLQYLQTGTENTRHRMNATLTKQQRQREAG